MLSLPTIRKSKQKSISVYISFSSGLGSVILKTENMLPTPTKADEENTYRRELNF